MKLNRTTIARPLSVVLTVAACTLVIDAPAEARTTRKPKAKTTKPSKPGKTKTTTKPKPNEPYEISLSPKPTTGSFCTHAKAWLAIEKSEWARDGWDIAWVNNTTRPIFDMWKTGPANLTADLEFVFKRTYYSRRGAVLSIAAASEKASVVFPDWFPEEFQALEKEVEGGIASARFAESMSRVTTYTKATCGVDVEGELRALAEHEAAGTTTPP